MLIEKTERSDSSNPQSAIRNPKFLFPACPGWVLIPFKVKPAERCVCIYNDLCHSLSVAHYIF